MESFPNPHLSIWIHHCFQSALTRHPLFSRKFNSTFLRLLNLHQLFSHWSSLSIYSIYLIEMITLAPYKYSYLKEHNAQYIGLLSDLFSSSHNLGQGFLTIFCNLYLRVILINKYWVSEFSSTSTFYSPSSSGSIQTSISWTSLNIDWSMNSSTT